MVFKISQNRCDRWDILPLFDETKIGIVFIYSKYINIINILYLKQNFQFLDIV